MITPMPGNFWNSLLDFIYPKVCISCKAKLTDKANIDDIICLGCWNKIKKNTPPFCHFCGRQLNKNSLSKGICPACIRKKMHFDRALSPCSYEGVMKELIHQFKYKNKDYLGQTLGKLMVDFIKEYDVPVHFMDAVIPVPLYKTRLREREFNQAQVLSDNIGRAFMKPVLKDVLKRAKHTRTQTELKDEDRALNVKGAFVTASPGEVKDKNILLVDDVFTSGATSSEAALALKEAGANIVFVLTLAN